MNNNLNSELVFAFGSRAGGKPKKFSDLDLLIKHSFEIGQEKLAILVEEFSESDLPCKVDLLLFSEILDALKKIIEEKSILAFPLATP